MTMTQTISGLAQEFHSSVVLVSVKWRPKLLVGGMTNLLTVMAHYSTSSRMTDKQ